MAVLYKHRLAFTSLRTVTNNSVTPGRLQSVESAVHSVWDTVRYTSFIDTAMSVSVLASDGGNKICTFTAESLHYNRYALDIYRSVCTADKHLRVHMLAKLRHQYNRMVTKTCYTTHHSIQQKQCLPHYTHVYTRTQMQTCSAAQTNHRLRNDHNGGLVRLQNRADTVGWTAALTASVRGIEQT